MTLQRILVDHGMDMLRGLRVTVVMCMLIWTSGILLGSLLGTAASRWKAVVGVPLKLVSVVMAAIPALVLLFWAHYPLQDLLDVVLDPFLTAVVTLSVLNIILVADLVQTSIGHLPKQFEQAAVVCGLTRRRTVLSIKLPLVVREVLPSLLLLQIVMLHATLFASLISVDEIFRVAQRINSRIYRPVEIYTLLALFFVCVCVPLHLLSNRLRAKYARDFSER